MMLKEKECRVIAGRTFADVIGLNRLQAVKDRVVSTQRVEGDIFIMNFGIFDELLKKDSNNYAEKLLTVDVDMTNGDAKISFKAESLL